MQFYFGIFQDWKVLENDYKSWKVLEICNLCVDHVIFTVSIACCTACKAYSKNKIIVAVATGWIKCGLGSPGKNVSESWKSPGNLFLTKKKKKKKTNPAL